MHLCKDYFEKYFIIYMDNFYSSPFLFFDLKKKKTGAVGTIRLNRKGISPDIVNAKLKQKGEMKISGDMPFTWYCER